MEQCQDPESVRWTSVPQPVRPGAGARVHQRGRAGLGPGRQPGVGGGGERPADRPAALRRQHRLPPGRRRRGRARLRAAPGRAGTAADGPGGPPGDHVRVRPGRHRGDALARVRRQLGLAPYGVAAAASAWRAPCGSCCPRRPPVRRLDGLPAKDDPMEPLHRWFDVPVLEGERVRLRPWREDDAPVTDRRRTSSAAGSSMASSSPQRVVRRLAHRPAQPDRGGRGRRAGASPTVGTDRPLGHIHCFRLAQALTAGSGMVGYWLNPEGRGRGAVAEALELVVGPRLRRPLGRRSSGCTGSRRAPTSTTSPPPGRCGGPGSADRHRAGDDGRTTTACRPTRSLYELLASTDRESSRVAPLVPAVLEGAGVRLRPWRDDDVPVPAGAAGRGESPVHAGRGPAHARRVPRLAGPATGRHGRRPGPALVHRRPRHRPAARARAGLRAAPARPRW